MTNPNRTLLWMLLFLTLVAALGIALVTPLGDAFRANSEFNAFIFFVLGVGILVNLRQVLILTGEHHWIEEFRQTDPDRPMSRKPRLLAPMAQMLGKREHNQMTLSTAAHRSLLESISMRLDESRDISRYTVGLLVFLGLLGTFWGLLQTIGSVSDVIGGMEVSGSDPSSLFNSLKNGLEGPLGGMGVAFSSSLFGLAGSLVLGFLDLQAGHAQNRFFNELEEWLSGFTRLSSGALGSDGEGSVPAYVQALLEQTADGLERMQRAIVDQDQHQHTYHDGITQLIEQLDRMARSQAALHVLIKRVAEREESTRMSDELRSELRLLNRTLAAALSQSTLPNDEGP